MTEDEMTVDQRAADPSVEPAEEQKSAFPSAITILAMVIVAVWIAAFFIPSGKYQFDESNRPIPGSYAQVESPLDAGERVQDLLLSPINGLYGIQNADGHVGPFNSGSLFGSAQVFLFILAIGGFMTVVFATGAMDRGISMLAYRLRERGNVLIVVLSILFAILGSVMTWSDEQLGFYALVIPLMLALRYDRIVAVAVLGVAPSMGVIGSTVTPFRIGIGSDAAGISIGDGIVLRLVLLVLCTTAMIIYTLRYANKVKTDPSASLVGISATDAEVARQAESVTVEPLTGRNKIVLAITGFTFVLLAFSIVPWGSILNNVAVDPVTHESVTKAFAWELGWWLPELTAMFIVMTLVTGIAGGLGESEISKNFMKGVVDFTGPAFLVAFARAVAVILTNTQTLDTVLNAMEGFVAGRSSVVFTLLLALISLPLSFLVGAGSAGMALVMPILAPLGDFAGVDRSLIVTLYSAVGGWLSNMMPTNAILMASLVLAKVRFDTYIKWLWPLAAIVMGMILVVSVVGSLL